MLYGSAFIAESVMDNSAYEAMRRGARNAVVACMGIRHDDDVFIMTDEATLPIGQLLAEEARRLTRDVRLRLLEEYAPRPILSMPEGLRSDLLASDPSVTFYAASGKPGEITFRLGLKVLLKNDLSVRHAHMIGVTPQLMASGMLADYDLIWFVTHHVYEQARLARSIRVTSDDGTALDAQFESWMRWVPCAGRYHATGEWGNLPEGETFTCPKTVAGVLVAQVLGDHFSEKYGVLADPLTVEIQDGRVKGVHCADRCVAEDFVTYLDSDPNGRRVGEFAIGTNVALTELTGNLLQDEKIPGVHLAFGDPYGQETGARWASAVHVDAVSPFCSVEIDGRLVLDHGRFLGLPAELSTRLYG